MCLWLFYFFFCVCVFCFFFFILFFCFWFSLFVLLRQLPQICRVSLIWLLQNVWLMSPQVRNMEIISLGSKNRTSPQWLLIFCWVFCLPKKGRTFARLLTAESVVWHSWESKIWRIEIEHICVKNILIKLTSSNARFEEVSLRPSTKACWCRYCHWDLSVLLQNIFHLIYLHK